MKQIAILITLCLLLAACHKTAPSGFITANVNGQDLTFNISAVAATPDYGGDSGKAINVQGFSAGGAQQIIIGVGDSVYLTARTYTSLQDSLYGNAVINFEDYQNDSTYYASASLPVIPRQAVTAVINSMSGGWVRGTFYGTMLTLNRPGNQPVTVVNGQFNVPISLVGNPNEPWK